jgi:hypothetical protein
VLGTCANRCVFCGFSPAGFGGKKLLLAGHIKPWKDSTPRERLDPRNGLAACPAHDVAFDTGVLTVNGGLRIHLAPTLADAVLADPLARQFYGRPPLRRTLLLPADAQPRPRSISTGIARESSVTDPGRHASHESSAAAQRDRTLRVARPNFAEPPGQRRSRRITMRGKPPETESVSAALVKPASSKSLRVPT